MNTAKKIIEQLGLQAHPEGGYFKESYRSSESISSEILDEKYTGPRNFSTCIYFLLTSQTFSAFHRINQDEIWHFYAGSPILLHTISDNGTYQEFIVGNNVLEGELPQLVVPARNWFAAKTINENDYSLVGCTVSPGFDFEDFELAERSELIKLFPKHEKLIKEFTRI